jgi:DNA-binding transcriptional MerR regulator
MSRVGRMTTSSVRRARQHRAPASAVMRIGELAAAVGVRPDTIRFYERAGALPRAGRARSRYCEYAEADAQRLRLLVDLRRLDLPLDQAAQLADGCATGHVARQAERLRDLDARLAELDEHIDMVEASREFRLGGPCCEAVHTAAQPQETTAAGGRQNR